MRTRLSRAEVAWHVPAGKTLAPAPEEQPWSSSWSSSSVCGPVSTGHLSVERSAGNQARDVRSGDGGSRVDGTSSYQLSWAKNLADHVYCSELSRDNCLSRLDNIRGASRDSVSAAAVWH
jgi:hypothetical protein